MLPQYNGLTNSTSKTIHVNPNFKRRLATENAVLQSSSGIPCNTHINPLFLEGHRQRPIIHMNPAFLIKFQGQQPQKQTIGANEFEEIKAYDLQRSFTDPRIAPSVKSTNTEQRKIICKSKNRLIREPLVKEKPLNILKPLIPQPPLLVLNKRKLIRKASTDPITANIKPLNSSVKLLKSAMDSKVNTTKYKLDNRVIKKKSLLPPTPKIKRTSFVGRYALRRTSSSLSQGLENKKSFANSTINKSLHKKLQLLNINGLLYKSTRNSLKLRETRNNSSSPSLKSTKPTITSTSSQISTVNVSAKSNQGLTIFVRGTKYIMDSNKFKLTRVNADQSLSLSPTMTRTNKPTTAACRQRIDIGGYTYISANSAKNVFIRSSNHLARAYVHNAKQKSLQMLAKSLVKSNIPCPIYQRVGKCAAFERGKCSKVHNKLQVAICSKFLRGECINTKCLLSHNVSLSKMPVCKFFLQGVCVRNDCPYLHKKLSNNTEICIDFLRGFCQLADKCNKRHEFACPEIERNRPCTIKTCIYCKGKLKKDKQLEKTSEELQKKITNHVEDASTVNSADTKESPTSLRYFKGPCDIRENSDDYEEVQAMEQDEDTTKVETVEGNILENEDYVRKSRPKLGALPAFIPL